MSLSFPTRAELRVMTVIYDYAPICGLKIANVIDRDPGGVYTLLKQLLDKQLVCCQENRAVNRGRNRVVYSLTDPALDIMNLAQRLNISA